MSAAERGRILVEVVRVAPRRPWRLPYAVGVTRDGLVLRFKPGAAARQLRRSVGSGDVVVYEVSRQGGVQTLADLGPDWSISDVDRLID